MRRYLLHILFFMSILSLSGTSVLMVRYWYFHDTDPDGLLRYQLQKLEGRQTDIDTVLLGDSSLANAIDVAKFNALTGHKTVSLPLTGLYGYAGTLAMLSRAIDTIPTLKRVVIFQTSDMLIRDTEYDGLFFTLSSYWPDHLPPRFQLGLLNVMRSRLFDYSLLSDTVLDDILPATRGIRWEAAFAATGDYIPQRPRTAAYSPPSDEGFSVDRINLNKLFFLAEIESLCAIHQLQCAYIHGPLDDRLAQNSADYFATVQPLITGSGLPLVCSRPVELRADQVGDSYDHVHPRWKDDATKAYAAMLTGFWAAHPVPCDPSSLSRR